MAPRIVLVAHAATSATRRGAFPLDEGIDGRGDLAVTPVRAVQYLTGPELRCRQTAAALGWAADIVDGFTDLDAGRWAGRELGELFGSEPESVQAWMTDVSARPPGGESFEQLVGRVGAALDARSWPDGRSVLVTSPLVIRAAVVHLLGAPTALMFGVDIEPLSATVLTGHGGRWKLRALMPWGTWNVKDLMGSPV